MQYLEVYITNILRDSTHLEQGMFGVLEAVPLTYLQNVLDSAQVMDKMIKEAQHTPPQDLKLFAHDLRSPLNGLRGFLEMLIYDDHPITMEQRNVVKRLMFFANQLMDETTRMLHQSDNVE